MKKVLLGLAVGFVCAFALTGCGETDQIKVYSRDTTSGTRDGFFTNIGYEDAKSDDKLLAPGTVIVDSNGSMLTSIAGDEYGIGYASLASVLETDTVKGLTYEGVEGTIENVQNGTYKLSRNFNYIVAEDADMTENQATMVKAFLKFMSSDEGMTIVSSNDGILMEEISEAPKWSELKTTDEDVLAAFKEYNPAALEKAAQNPAYNNLLNKVAAAYSAPNTDVNQSEMIALVLNFDNSVRLQVVREDYFNGRTLQLVSGEELAALEDSVSEELQQIVKDVYKNTLKVKDLQIDRYKDQIKAVKKNDSLTKEQKQEAVDKLNGQVKAVKAEIKTLKKNSKQKIKDTAAVYLAEMRVEFTQRQNAQLSSAQQKEEAAAQAPAQEVKADNKKPVAK